MRIHVLIAVALLGLSAWGAEKELQLADGRLLRGEVLSEQNEQVLLSVKVEGISAQVRVPKKDILSMKDAPAVQVSAAGQAPAGAVEKAVLAAPVVIGRTTDNSFDRVRQLLAAAAKEATTEDGVPPGYSGYPFPTWQHWPWLFMVGGNSNYNNHHHRHGCRPRP